MAITKAQKTDMLTELNDQFDRAKGIVFARYSGLSVMDAQDLRRSLKKANVDYKVAKKTLLKLAAKRKGIDLTDEIIAGPIGVAFGFDDEIVAAQRIADFAKKFENFELMGGIVEGKIIDAATVKTLASIPSREVLLAKFMGSTLSPLNGFVSLLNNVVGSFVRVVNAYQEKKNETEGIPPVKEIAIQDQTPKTEDTPETIPKESNTEPSPEESSPKDDSQTPEA
ncbi:MAG: 50S ribosomal protein L10, large subunit ribosomal protein L10 [Candidatus Peregrinibacteria bacterium GW2011_GWE2_39_6]|nr:MAG: 50S ribosomal protein L10, large subunit ribosomal protein L10 [Candidatus Peregrinibacteria bacterium GW2011_GWF2_39_17]KKR25741.1 MAG: 50S ribosomal protein L10, large subunit ribosomal protein L10 [Candidatus Peregrinibacteria bacterium GW2011_GWE2_39_6]HCW32134.1 50S ribosomal protein L10 [Candidatus Peregrinibacteria bacterium]